MLNKILEGIGERVGVGENTQTTVNIYGASKKVQRSVCAFLEVNGFTLSSTEYPGAHIHPHDKSKPDYISITFYNIMEQYKEKPKSKGGDKSC